MINREQLPKACRTCGQLSEITESITGVQITPSIPQCAAGFDLGYCVFEALEEEIKAAAIAEFRKCPLMPPNVFYIEKFIYAHHDSLPTEDEKNHARQEFVKRWFIEWLGYNIDARFIYPHGASNVIAGRKAEGYYIQTIDAVTRSSNEQQKIKHFENLNDLYSAMIQAAPTFMYWRIYDPNAAMVNHFRILAAEIAQKTDRDKHPYHAGKVDALREAAAILDNAKYFGL